MSNLNRRKFIQYGSVILGSGIFAIHSRGALAAQAPIKLNSVSFTGDGPFDDQVLEFRIGDQVIGTATITEPGTSFPVSGGSGTIAGTDFVSIYQNNEFRGTFITAVSNAKPGSGIIKATASVYGGGWLDLAYTVS